MEFDESAVRRFSIRSGEQTHVFERQEEDRWTYRAEPDLPLDPKEVDNLLLRIKDLKTERYVRHTNGDQSEYGLSSPLHEVTLNLDDGGSRVLRVSGGVCTLDPDKGHYADVEGRDGVFLLTPGTIKRFEVSLVELEADR